MKFDSKTAVRMNLRMITKNHAADPKREFLTKSILKPYDAQRAYRKRGS